MDFIIRTDVGCSVDDGSLTAAALSDTSQNSDW